MVTNQITINNGGTLDVIPSGTGNATNNNVTLNDGSTIAHLGGSTASLYGTNTINGTVTISCPNVAISVYSTLLGAGTIRVASSAGASIYSTNLSLNATWIVGINNQLEFGAESSAGYGRYVLGTGATIRLAAQRNWSFTNQSVSGNGYLEIGTVSAGNAGTWTLSTAATTISPGAGSACGILAVRNGYASGRAADLWLTNSLTTNCTLITCVKGGGGSAGTDYDQLTVSRHLYNLNKCDLQFVVTNGVTSAQTSGHVYTNVWCGGNLSNGTFNSVVFSPNGWGGTVTYFTNRVEISALTFSGASPSVPTYDYAPMMYRHIRRR